MTKASYSLIKESDVAQSFDRLHDGEGTVSLRYFRFGGAPAPANFVIYDLPPGSSEGVHAHLAGDREEGPYDEYYYVIEGEGEMSIEGETVPIRAGDHVHTPLGLAHGVRNSHAERHLRIFLTFIAREVEPVTPAQKRSIPAQKPVTPA